MWLAIPALPCFDYGTPTYCSIPVCTLICTIVLAYNRSGMCAIVRAAFLIGHSSEDNDGAREKDKNHQFQLKARTNSLRS